ECFPVDRQKMRHSRPETSRIQRQVVTIRFLPSPLQVRTWWFLVPQLLVSGRSLLRKLRRFLDLEHIRLLKMESGLWSFWTAAHTIGLLMSVPTGISFRDAPGHILIACRKQVECNKPNQPT